MSDSVHVVCPKCGAKNRVPTQRLNDGPVCGKCKSKVLEASPAELGGELFAKQVAGSDIPVLVDFWAPWCGPCKMMAPAFAEAARALHPRVRLAKVNTEQEQALAARFGIQSIPTMVLFRGGQEVDRVSGAMSAQQIAQWLQGKA